MKNIIGCLFGLLVMLMLVTACKTYKAVPANVTVHDTVVTTNTVIVRDTVLVAPGDSVEISVPVAAFKKDTIIHAKNKRAAVTGTVKNGKVNLRCECDTASIKAKLYDQVRQELRSKSKETIQPPIVVEKKYVPWWVNILAWIGGASCLIVGIYLGYRKLKPRL